MSLLASGPCSASRRLSRDAGVVIPTVNEAFEGEAPDLGALEVGAPAPRYGPRWLTWQPFYR